MQHGIARCAQSDAIAFAYLLMDAAQREYFEFSRWYVDELEGCIFGGGRGNPISVSSDNGSDLEMPGLEYVD